MNQTWEEQFNVFLQEASQREKDVIAGLQHYYESKTMANDRAEEEEEIRDPNILHDEDDNTNMNDFDLESSDTSVSHDKYTMFM